MPVRMELTRVLIRETDDFHIVELREVEGQRTFSIMIGITEAAAIERRWMGQEPVRPQTHELLESVIKQLGATVKHVIVNDLRDATFYARLVLQRDGQEISIDSRPSDAIALGVATEVPIYVEEHVLEEAQRSDT